MRISALCTLALAPVFLAAAAPAGAAQAAPAAAHPAAAAHPGRAAAAPPVTAATGCTRIGTTNRYNCNVWKTTTSYRVTSTSQPVGILHAGTNYFYCQDTGQEISREGHHNDWWAKTDDDSGNAGVWISDIYISGGVDDGPIPGLPQC